MVDEAYSADSVDLGSRIHGILCCQSAICHMHDRDLLHSLANPEYFDLTSLTSRASFTALTIITSVAIIILTY